MLKERKLNVGPEKLGSFRFELHVSEMIAVRERPTAVYPRTNHQHVQNTMIILVNRIKRPERAGEVFRIEPATNRHHGAFDVLHMPRQIASFPVVVIGRVRYLIDEERIRTL